LGSLNWRGLERDFGLGRDLGFVCLGMGNCLGLGCCLHHVSPTTSLTSITPTCNDGVMQNHQLETISTGQPKTARPDFLSAGPISNDASRRHPFRRTPYCFRVTGYGTVTEHLQPIKLLRQSNMTIITARSQPVAVVTQFVGTHSECFNARPSAMIAQRSDVSFASPQPCPTEFRCVLHHTTADQLVSQVFQQFYAHAAS
jgi:hypothetical protein